MVRLLLITWIALHCSSCGIIQSFKIRDAMLAERMKTHSFKREMPFKTINGFIVVEMTIGNKKGNFILDTGASTMLDDDFAKGLAFKILGKKKHIDTRGKKKLLKTVIFDNLSIGDIDFKNIVASISDLAIVNILKSKACMDVSGLLGANVMNKGVWQIDYRNQKITISDSRDSIPLPENKKVVGFTGTGTPLVRLSSKDKYLGESRFDTGNSGSFEMSKSLALPLLPLKNSIKRYGFSSGAFGTYIDTNYITLLPTLTFGQNFETKNTRVAISSGLSGAPLIGYEFLKDYVTTIDWKYQEITFSDYQPSLENPNFTFGFSLVFENGKLFISSLIEQSAADKAGLKLNDQIVKINGINCGKMTQSDYCDFRNQKILANSDTLELTIKKGDKDVKYTLSKTDLSDLLKKEDE
jgi:Aspartyl protease/PDZ domain